ncbi:hypothetical protein [Streptomyces marispadix]|uniref:DUF4190 domain-containing protein n=1 Tax=Streptomyces marispadix TaxID=2922868 RepID=A0ABS9SYJ9_9ACTN|nr:hypothetical protein [Streptomyces marispadix]MCH6161278.1 hypothetical protein [Streptomyces marispadix]
MTDRKPLEGAPSTPPAPRSAGRILGAVVLVCLAAGLFYIGVDALASPGRVVAESSGTGRSPDSESEAKIGGLLMCLFGVSVLCGAIALLQKPGKGKPSVGATPPRP